MQPIATILAGFVMAIACAGCGETTPTSPVDPRGSSDADDIVRLVQDFAAAYDAGDDEQVCSLLSTQFRTRLIASVRPAFPKKRTLTCASALKVAGVPRPAALDSTVSDLEITGSRATGTVNGDTWKFAMSHDRWSISYLD